MDRVAKGIAYAGAVLLLGGLAYGLVPVGDGCGSGFNPTIGGSESRSVSDCSTLLGGRTDTAWQLIFAGSAALAGASALQKKSAGSDQPTGSSLD